MLSLLTWLKSCGCDITQSAKNSVVIGELTPEQFKELTGADYEATTTTV